MKNHNKDNIDFTIYNTLKRVFLIENQDFLPF